jgi:NADH dehydrogenase
LAAALTEGKPLAPFVFRNYGNATIVRRHTAIFDLGRGWLDS